MTVFASSGVVTLTLLYFLLSSASSKAVIFLEKEVGVDENEHFCKEGIDEDDDDDDDDDRATPLFLMEEKELHHHKKCLCQFVLYLVMYLVL